MPTRVHHLNCGTFCPVGQLLINGRGSPLAPGRLVCHCLLLETDDGLTLVDTGLGLDDVRDPDSALPGRLWQALNQPQLRAEETAVAQIKALGLDPRDVRHIVLTHLDFDHAGGLPDFPQALVHVSAREFDAAAARATPREQMRYAPRHLAHRPRLALYPLEGERWFGFDAVRPVRKSADDARRDLGPDVLLVPLLGHSRGHCGVAVNTPEGWLLHVGDAAFWHGELDSPDGHRRCPPGLRLYQNIFQFDRDQRLHNQRRLRDLVRRQYAAPAADPAARVRVLCAHDPEMMRQFAGPSLPAWAGMAARGAGTPAGA
jgi:glyoxylase-like metal-dependent hydrolase (beta-lactamase superfamily II)